ncbi:unnamed protein product, partial [Timema podura]|nr:unnamed protein product [Timema podura]
YQDCKPSQSSGDQGKVELWVDMFPDDDNFPPSVNITPRQPVKYELRVIVWNTQDVVLQEHDFLTGHRISDIFVKGSHPADGSLRRNRRKTRTCTNRSLTGEGNFNYRFVFPFSFLSTEGKIEYLKKDSTFARDKTRYKLPCQLTLQAWDNDLISKDDYLGSLVLNLLRLPRGAKSPKHCTLDVMAPDAPTFNLFKIKRTKGWWPFEGVDEKTGERTLAVRVTGGSSP